MRAGFSGGLSRQQCRNDKKGNTGAQKYNFILRGVHNHLLTRSSRLLAIVLVAGLYLANLNAMGMFEPDEPRYADVGRAMAQSGDWITPRLWGQPWFEKPALLYWMTATGFKLTFNPDLAPRLPVAILSLLFLVFFWWRCRIEWDDRVAFFAATLLATSAGWLAYSHVAVTDLPLAAFFSAAVLLSLPWLARGETKTLPFAAACLGIAALAKGLVPLILFLPILALGWKRLRDWVRPAPLLAFSVCALPWYILCTIRNGSAFLRVFFLEQQFGRFTSGALQHVQPFWFYVPILLVLLFPWFPLFAFPSLAFPKDTRRDPRTRALAAVVLFGFVFFSASVNKLPGYLIPLLPSAFVLPGLGLARAARPILALTLSLVLLAALPAASTIVPHVLAARHWSALEISLNQTAAWLVTAAVIGFFVARQAPRFAPLLAAAALLWFQFTTFPRIDAEASSRSIWLHQHPQCTPVGASRSISYGLYYYSGGLLPSCRRIEVL